ncbi:Panacea domain-containing protein [Campylobacter sp. MG1]|uniref:Panacea domain-containing protein n=1 Tax=Campylobacter sp. MG1 TaxID=2976332 RepID=UPI00226CA9AC|nr:type II toxin-antitoxin system antitoxin SocA domain-containing protein [Campylobacter sp. MG1]
MTALQYAKNVLNFCNYRGIYISNLQLQKILYFLQMQSYKDTNRSLFSDDFLAYPYGPIIYDVYIQYSIYGARNIFENFESYDNSLSKKQELLVYKCATMPSYQLVNISHKSGGAWDKTYRNRNGIGSVIRKELIKEEAPYTIR